MAGNTPASSVASASPSEFALIRQYFTRPAADTVLGVGDDAALFVPAPGMQLAVSTDMLVAGTHFLADDEPEALGWKTLAVNLSDLAAMGATPRWALLAMALPAADPDWLAAFAQGLFACADAHRVALIGGDTTRGPLNLCVTIFGEVPAGQAITRAGARPGDEIWISGQPGRAALGLADKLGHTQLKPAAREACLDALARPQPRVALGQALRGLASAMLDVSDGLAGDLGHVLAASGVGAVLDEARLPLAMLRDASDDEALIRRCLLSGGDDYELLFTAPAECRARIEALSAPCALPLHRIGACTGDAGHLLLHQADGQLVPLAARAYDHFG